MKVKINNTKQQRSLSPPHQKRLSVREWGKHSTVTNWNYQQQKQSSSQSHNMTGFLKDRHPITFTVLGLILFLVIIPSNLANEITSSSSSSETRNPEQPQTKSEEQESSEETVGNDLESQLVNPPRIIRAGNDPNSGELQYSRLSRALERIHFGPLLRLRPFNSRALPRRFAWSDLPDKAPPEKKALSFFSRFYPVLQHGSGSGSSDSLMSGYIPRRRISFPHSGESIPSGRYSRPVMRLRWGK